MNKIIIFLFLVLFSNSAFSISYFTSFEFREGEFGWYYNIERDFFTLSYLDSLVGTYKSCTLITNLYGEVSFSNLLQNDASCFVAGWSIQDGFHRETESSNLDYYAVTSDFAEDIPPACPIHMNTVPYVAVTYQHSFSWHYHSQCTTDAGISWMTSAEFGCPEVLSFSFKKFYFCRGLPPQQLFSEKTAKKENDLLSESNSKLGLIANDKATDTNLLVDALNTIRSILASNFAIFGTGTNVDSAENFSTDATDLSEISPTISNFGSCPSSISFSVLGDTQNFSYQPVCDFAVKLRPLVIAAARVAAAWILIGAL